MGFFSRIFSRQAEAEPAAPIVKLPGDRILRYKITGKTQEPEGATRGAFFVDPGRRSPM